MGKELDNIANLLTQNAKRQVPMQNTWVTCTSVDWDAKTMKCKGVTDDLPYFDVLLGLGSSYVKPVQGSKCLIGSIQNKSAASFIIYAEEIEEYLIEDKSGFKIHLNDGELSLNGDAFGGLIKIGELVGKINSIENKVNEIKAACESVVVTLAPSGTFPLAPFFSPIAPLANTQVNQIENPKIKHGNG